MTQTVASIDVGSHTARLLIARRSESSPWGWTPLLRQRVYVRLTDEWGPEGEKEIGRDAEARVMEALAGFSRSIADYNVEQVHAVATGVIREAAHSDRFLDRLHKGTGIVVDLISGEKEALLSGRGACAALDIHGDSLVFDLGGGTTEFLRHLDGDIKALSLPLGAAVLTKEFIQSDPPAASDLEAVSREVERRLLPVLSDIAGSHLVVGTGGSVAALAAMVHDLTSDDVRPEKVNGLILTLPQLETYFGEMKLLSTSERAARFGLDTGRADVIVAGTLVVIGILRFLGTSDLMVSMSDLLEGLLIDN